MRILQEEATLEEIVRLVGIESLSPKERLILETAKSIREDFLHQLAFDPEDTYTSLEKQYRLLKIIIHLHEQCDRALDEGLSFKELSALKVREKIARLKFIPESGLDRFDRVEEEISKEIVQVKTQVKSSS